MFVIKYRNIYIYCDAYRVDCVAEEAVPARLRAQARERAGETEAGKNRETDRGGVGGGDSRDRRREGLSGTARTCSSARARVCACAHERAHARIGVANNSEGPGGSCARVRACGV